MMVLWVPQVYVVVTTVGCCWLRGSYFGCSMCHITFWVDDGVIELTRRDWLSHDTFRQYCTIWVGGLVGGMSGWEVGGGGVNGFMNLIFDNNDFFYDWTGNLVFWIAGANLWRTNVMQWKYFTTYLKEKMLPFMTWLRTVKLAFALYVNSFTNYVTVYCHQRYN